MVTPPQEFSRPIRFGLRPCLARGRPLGANRSCMRQKFIGGLRFFHAPSGANFGFALLGYQRFVALR